ncbi:MULTISPECIES: TetR/AcrR family transcriptional regulator [Paenibacillus]|uniref:TetR/AcrR family transcriptional regulator n=1 Tax=Paenibacillus agri TaxID=2744309 RepID=A0A850EW39_9BACL|nr:TetR/AcrR family transcriptional regulator [Paenibacillus agri]NUU64140.1 TetR/AcrR family transcriptional regulator [Paenibacillus agri]
MGKREDITDATLDLIDELGLQSVTIAQILKKAKVGSGTLFNYFRTKDELVHEVYRLARNKMGYSLLEGYDSTASLYERFTSLHRNRIRFGMKYRKEFLFSDSYSFSPYIPPELRNMDESGEIQEIMSVLSEGQKQGLIRDMDAKLCHQITYGIVASVLKGYYIQKYELDEKREKETLEACWKAIKL